MSEVNLSDLAERPVEEIERMLDNPEPVQPESEVPAVPAEPAPAEPEPKAAEPVPEPVAAPEPTQEDLDKQILLARLEAFEANNKKLEARLVGRESGERGYIKQLQDRIKSLESQRAAPEEPQYVDSEPVPERRAVPAPSRDSVAAWAVGQAVQGAASAFASSHPDYQELAAEVSGYLSSSGYDAQRILLENDPIEAAKEVTRVLDEAYWHIKYDRKAKAVAELTQRKADQVRSLDEAKRKATVSGSGAPPVPPPHRKSFDEMTADEAEAELDRLLRKK